MPHLRAASAIFIASGGDKEIRTLDPLLAKQVLYQLSYTPIGVVLRRLELRTPTLSVWCSNQLS